MKSDSFYRVIDRTPPTGIRKKHKPSSQTTGRTKGITASPAVKTYCYRNRSYRKQDYELTMSTIGKKKIS